jgi:sortase A
MNRSNEGRVRIVRLGAFCVALIGVMLTAFGVVSIIVEEQTRIADENIDPQTFDFAVTVTPVTANKGKASQLAIGAQTQAATATGAAKRAAQSAVSISVATSLPRESTDVAQPDPRETAAPLQIETPKRIVIPAIDLDAPILPVKVNYKDGDPAAQWQVPTKRAAGWHNTSALLGEIGNLVLNGHHNIRGRVFERLKDLKAGDLIFVYGDHMEVVYSVAERRLLKERGQKMDVLFKHAKYIQPTTDERLTLVTCWPPSDYSYRLILIARPVQDQTFDPTFHDLRDTPR